LSHLPQTRLHWRFARRTKIAHSRAPGWWVLPQQHGTVDNGARLWCAILACL